MITLRTQKINEEWIREMRDYFRRFLKETRFPEPSRYGQRGPKFEYPEWLIMFIGFLAVKQKIKTYLALHRFLSKYWGAIGGDLGYKLIPESTMRYRLKKICFKFGETPGYVISMFPETFFDQRDKCR